MSTLVGRALGGVVNPVVNSVDMNSVVQRIDWDELLENVDMNRVLDRIDVDRLLERINMDRLIDRLPIEAILERSNISNIIARSTTGMFSEVLDSIRAQAIRADHLAQGMGRCRCFWKSWEEWELPPRPGISPGDDDDNDDYSSSSSSSSERGSHYSWGSTSMYTRKHRNRVPADQNNDPYSHSAAAADRDNAYLVEAAPPPPPPKPRHHRHHHHNNNKNNLRYDDYNLPIPKRPMDMAVAVQGRNAGFVSRALAFIIDEVCLIFSYFVGLALLDAFYSYSTSVTFDVPPWVIIFVFFWYGAMYDWLCFVTVGRTLGKVLMGLMIIQYDKTMKRIGIWQALARAVFMSNWLFLLVCASLGLVRKDRRGVHDVVCRTVVVYAWDARNLRLRMKARTDQERGPYMESYFDEENV